MIERLENLAQLCRDFIDIGEDKDVWQRHLETIEEVIGIYNEWWNMWSMLEANDPNACVALVEDLEAYKTVEDRGWDMDDLYERVRE
jgi:hypothetical protein